MMNIHHPSTGAHGINASTWILLLISTLSLTACGFNVRLAITDEVDADTLRFPYPLMRTISGDQTLQILDGGRFVLLTRDADGERLSLQCFDDFHHKAWVTSLDPPQEVESFKDNQDHYTRVGYVRRRLPDEIDEVPISFHLEGRSLLVLGCYRKKVDRDSDSLVLVGRVIDTANGRELTRRVLHRALVQRRVDQFRSDVYSLTRSKEGSQYFAYIRSSGMGDNGTHDTLDGVRFNWSLVTVDPATVVIKREQKKDNITDIAIDYKGRMYVVIQPDERTFQLFNCVRDTLVKIGEHKIADTLEYCQYWKVDPSYDEGGRVNVEYVIGDDTRFFGYGRIGWDLEDAKTLDEWFFPLSVDAVREKSGDPEFAGKGSSWWLQRDDGRSRAAVFQQVTRRPGSTPVIGNVTIMAFDTSGVLAGASTVERDFAATFDDDSYYPLHTTGIPGDRVRVVYIDEGGLVTRDFSTVTAQPVSEQTRLVLSEYFFYDEGSMKWVGPRTLMLMGFCLRGTSVFSGIDAVVMKITIRE